MSAGSEPVLAALGSLDGQTVGRGRFQILAELGRGGMSEVYRARDRQRGREVALKVIAARYIGRPEREQRFRNEADYAQRVGNHPHVLSVLDVGELLDCGRRPFMTMDVVEGPTLAMELAMCRRLPVQRAVAWARQIADGLRAVHMAGIVHRDLTPSNILIEASTNLVKIFDFGLAADMDAPVTASTSRLTLLGEVPGTHGYMAPEQAVLASPTGAMDVHAFGAVLTEMLVGHNPFAHLDRSEYIEWQQHSRDEAPSIRRWGMALPDGLAELIDDCLRRDPSERPQNGTELLARLDALVPPPVVALFPLRRAPSVPVTVVDDDAETHRDEVAPPVRRRRSRLVVGLLASLLVLTGVVAGWWMRAAQDAPTSPQEPENPGGRSEEPASETSRVMDPAAQGSSRRALEERPEPASTTTPPPLDGPTPRKPEIETPKAVAPAGTRPPERTRPAPTSEATISCETRREQAHDALRRKRWKQVLASTSSSRCWPDATERLRLRVRALAETADYAACVRVAAAASDAEVVRWRSRCEEGLWTP